MRKSARRLINSDLWRIVVAKKILFIAPNASSKCAFSAFTLLMDFFVWMKANTDIPFNILAVRGGDLEPEFKKIAPTFVLLRDGRRAGLLNSILSRLELMWKVLLLRFKFTRSNTALIYSMTMSNGYALKLLSSIGCPVICHIQELEYVIEYLGGLEGLKRYINQYIACCAAGKNCLVNSYAIPESKIETIDQCLAFPRLKIQHDRNYIRGLLGIPRDAVIVYASGTTEWRKAPDIFIQLARIVNGISKDPVYFIWIGGEDRGPVYDRLIHDVKKIGLEERVKFLGAKSDPYDYYSACDIFILVSREDMFPMVVLEAAYIGKPILCFDRAGGAKEFVEDDAGFVVPYLDVEAMSAKIIDLVNSPQLRGRLGGRAREKVIERHDVAMSAPKILGVIKKFLT